MYCTTETILMAEHEAIAKTIESSDREFPEDYGLERIKGIQIMVDVLMQKEKEGI